MVWSWRYPADTIIDSEHADNLALPSNTSTQGDSILHSLNQEAEGIGLQLNANKTELMSFEREEAISF